MWNEPHLAPRSANNRPLTPLDFLDRAMTTSPDQIAVLWRDQSWNWAEFGAVVGRMAEYLRARGIGPGNVVSVMCPNRPEMLAAHYAVPAVGAVLNSINTRLDADAVAWIFEHSQSRLVIADPTCAAIAGTAAKTAGVPFIELTDDGKTGAGLSLLAGDMPAAFDLTAAVVDEWQPIALNYTSGTTGNPKGVVLHHRGAWINAIGNVLTLGLNNKTSYLWTMPMFHCNGWAHTWAVTAALGIHVCLDRVDPAAVFAAIERHGITHMSCAPVVLYMLLNDPARHSRNPAKRMLVATGGASPTPALVAQMEDLGFDFLHLYGLTESFGPTSLRRVEEQEAGLSIDDRAELLSRQGSRHVTANRLRVIDDTGADVPMDGETLGEIVLAGNNLLAGYFRDAEATEAAFAGGMFHTGDLAVMYPGGQIEIRDRAKDIIITGGENVSSLEIEKVLHKHGEVLLAAVVARPDPKWGEVPMAFVETKPDSSLTSAELEAFCRQHLAGFKIPRAWAFDELPRTATGKIQKYVLRDRARATQGQEKDRP